MIGRAMLRWPASTRLLSAALPSTAPASTRILAIRAYATPGRPKSVVGEPSRPVKRAVKRAPAKNADGTSAAEKKPAAGKRKAAAKRNKAALTEEQKAAQKERMEAAQAALKARQAKKKASNKALADKQKIVELKKLALDAPARPAASGYTSYTSEKMRAMGPLTGEDGQKQALPTRMKVVAAGWKALGPADIEHYNHIARVKLEEGEAAYKRFVESHTPDEIRKANNVRKELNRRDPAKPGKKPKYPEIKDERVVIRPRNAFIQFVTTRATSADFNNIMAKDRMKLLGVEWKELSADEKTKYEDLAKQDKTRYLEEYKDTYGHELSIKSSPTAAAA